MDIAIREIPSYRVADISRHTGGASSVSEWADPGRWEELHALRKGDGPRWETGEEIVAIELYEGDWCSPGFSPLNTQRCIVVGQDIEDTDHLSTVIIDMSHNAHMPIGITHTPGGLYAVIAATESYQSPWEGYEDLLGQWLPDNDTYYRGAGGPLMALYLNARSDTGRTELTMRVCCGVEGRRPWPGWNVARVGHLRF